MVQEPPGWLGGGVSLGEGMVQEPPGWLGGGGVWAGAARRREIGVWEMSTGGRNQGYVEENGVTRRLCG